MNILTAAKKLLLLPKNINDSYKKFKALEEENFDFIESFYDGFYDFLSKEKEALGPVRLTEFHEDSIDEVVRAMDTETGLNTVRYSYDLDNNYTVKSMDDFVGLDLLWSLDHKLPLATQVYSHFKGQKAHIVYFMFLLNKPTNKEQLAHLGDSTIYSNGDRFHLHEQDVHYFRVSEYDGLELYAAKNTPEIVEAPTFLESIGL